MGDDLASLNNANISDLRALSELLGISWTSAHKKRELVQNIAAHAMKRKLKCDRRRRIKLVIKHQVAARPYPNLITISPRGCYSIGHIKKQIRKIQGWGTRSVIRLTWGDHWGHPRDLQDDETVKGVLEGEPFLPELHPTFTMYSSGDIPADDGANDDASDDSDDPLRQPRAAASSTTSRNEK